IEAVAALPEAWLLMAGDGPLADEVAGSAQRQLPGRHRLSGPVDDLAAVWAAADVVLLSSATEGMPGVLLEAALHGIPAVATDVGAVAELVLDGRTGRVVAPEASPASVAAALAEVVDHRDAWGSAARAHAAATFTWPTVAPAWVALLAEVGSRVR
ncbi:MAG: glycosyltransferase, partial [Ilumatobacteraceae bacterium]